MSPSTSRLVLLFLCCLFIFSLRVFTLWEGMFEISHRVGTNGNEIKLLGHPWTSQIDYDLEPFKNGIDSILLNKAIDAVNKTSGYYVSIRKNIIYYVELGNMVASETPNDLLLLLAKASMCFKIVDVDFVIQFNDYCDEKNLPIFGWNKHISSSCLLYPWVQFLWNKQYHTYRPMWADKISKGIFRGSTTGGIYDLHTWNLQHRSKLVLFCLSHQNLCDASFTNIVQATPEGKIAILKNLSLSKALTYDEEIKFKYIILIDGNGAPASRSAKAFASSSVVIKQESEYMEFFYSSLRPWVHYVPISVNLEDLGNKLKWLQKHDDLAQKLANGSLLFSRKYFTDFIISDYIASLLNRYGSLYTSSGVLTASKRLKVSKDVISYIHAQSDPLFQKRCKNVHMY